MRGPGGPRKNLSCVYSVIILNFSNVVSYVFVVQRSTRVFWVFKDPTKPLKYVFYGTLLGLTIYNAHNENYLMHKGSCKYFQFSPHRD